MAKTRKSVIKRKNITRKYGSKSLLNEKITHAELDRKHNKILGNMYR